MLTRCLMSSETLQKNVSTWTSVVAFLRSNMSAKTQLKDS
ncbi:hypothetical protein LINPERHAP1_LOCUS12973 [Linum perenne]